MQLLFLGTGAAFNPALGNNSAFFQRGKDLYLIDCGETTFAALLRLRLLRECQGAVTVILTHTHADHCGSLGTLALYCAEKLKRPLTLVYPGEQARTLLSLMGVRADQYTLVTSLTTPPLTVTPMQTRHVAAIPAYAYLIDDGVETIYYSGDTGELPSVVLDGLRQGRIARAYQDVGPYNAAPPENPPHLPLSTLCALVEPALRSKFVLMHFSGDYLAEAASYGFIIAARDRKLAVR